MKELNYVTATLVVACILGFMHCDLIQLSSAASDGLNAVEYAIKQSDVDRGALIDQIYAAQQQASEAREMTGEFDARLESLQRDIDVAICSAFIADRRSGARRLPSELHARAETACLSVISNVEYVRKPL